MGRRKNTKHGDFYIHPVLKRCFLIVVGTAFQTKNEKVLTAHLPWKFVYPYTTKCADMVPKQELWPRTTPQRTEMPKLEGSHLLPFQPLGRRPWEAHSSISSCFFARCYKKSDKKTNERGDRHVSRFFTWFKPVFLHVLSYFLNQMFRVEKNLLVAILFII